MRGARVVLCVAVILGLGSPSHGRSLEPQGDALLRQAKEQSDAGRHQEALDLCNRALGQTLDATGQMAAYYHRARAFMGLKGFEAAVRDYTRAIDMVMSKGKDLDGYKSMIINERGVAHDALGNTESALRDYSQAIGLSAESIQPLNNRAVILYKLGRYKEAIEDCNQYLRHDTKWAGAYFVRGAAKIGLKDGTAIADMKIAATLGHPGAQDALRQAGISW